MRRGFKTWAERLALEQRSNLNLGNVSPLPARALAGYLEVTVIAPHQIPGIPQNILHQLQYADHESWSAITLERNGCTLIIHNQTHSPRRQESDIMHELSHILCNHEPSQLVKLDFFPIPFRSYDPVQEEEASWLGACLQLPRNALLWAVRRGMNNSMIVEHFGASMDLVKYRRQITGVDFQIRRRSTW